MNNLVKPAIETAIEYIPFFGPFVVKAFENYETDIYNSHVIDRINRVEAAIKKMDNYDSKIHWIESNENKLIVVRKYLENLFYYIDPALLDINIKIFVDYVDDKKIKNEYDYFLEKVVFLNRYSFKVLKQISNCEKDSEYYKWDDLLKQYNINEDLKYYHFINKDNKNEVDMELSYGIESLIEHGFISVSYTNYPGSIIKNIISLIQITGLGKILLNYI